MTSRSVPAHPPIYYVKLNLASYENNVKGYLVINQIPAEHLTESTQGGWRVVLFRHRDSGELCVTFKGTEPTPWENLDLFLRNWKDNLFHQFRSPRKLISRFETLKEQWEREYGKIRVLTGHSTGGFFAARVAKADLCLRITFNGHKAKRGPTHINLRTKNDVVSSVVSSKRRYITVGKGGHALMDCERVLANHSWTALVHIGRGLGSSVQVLAPTE